MDLFQLSYTCPKCGKESKTILISKIKMISCEHCSTEIIKAKKFDGVVYVLSNPCIPNLVKIGCTTTDPYKRAKQISGTGSPGEFLVDAFFPSHNPREDEKKVHKKLSKQHKDKEHFAFDSVSAVVKVRSILNKEPLEIRKKIIAEVYQKIENNKLEMQKRLKRN